MLSLYFCNKTAQTFAKIAEKLQPVYACVVCELILKPRKLVCFVYGMYKVQKH